MRNFKARIIDLGSSHNKFLAMTEARVLILAFIALCASCSDDSAVVWQRSLRSPDGGSVIVAKTTQYSGPGTAAVFTTVEVARADGERKPVEILVFEDPSELNPAAIQVEMSWTSDGHLEIAYPKEARLHFRADLYGDIEIKSHPRQ